MQGGDDGDGEEKREDALGGKGEGEPVGGFPGSDEERVDESAEVEEHRIKGYDAHGLKGIAIDDVARNYRVANLDAGRD